MSILMFSACAGDWVWPWVGPYWDVASFSFKSKCWLLQVGLHSLYLAWYCSLAAAATWHILFKYLCLSVLSSRYLRRWCVVFGGGLIACYGSHLVHYDGAGSLAAIILAFVAMVQWRRCLFIFLSFLLHACTTEVWYREGWTDHNPVSNAFGKMWIILEPILFALIGSEVQVNPRSDLRTCDTWLDPGGQDWPAVSRPGSRSSLHSSCLQNAWGCLRGLRRQPEQEGEDLHGFCLAP